MLLNLLLSARVTLRRLPPKSLAVMQALSSTISKFLSLPIIPPNRKISSNLPKATLKDSSEELMSGNALNMEIKSLKIHLIKRKRVKLQCLHN